MVAGEGDVEFEAWFQQALDRDSALGFSVWTSQPLALVVRHSRLVAGEGVLAQPLGQVEDLVFG